MVWARKFDNANDCRVLEDTIPKIRVRLPLLEFPVQLLLGNRFCSLADKDGMARVDLADPNAVKTPWNVFTLAEKA
jgi:hypothetical protein